MTNIKDTNASASDDYTRKEAIGDHLFAFDFRRGNRITRKIVWKEKKLTTPVHCDQSSCAKPESSSKSILSIDIKLEILWKKN